MAARNKVTMTEVNVRFCRALQNHPCIYDAADLNYKKNEERTKAWGIIAKECNESVNAVKGRWRNIRKQYINYVQGNRREFVLKDELQFFLPHVPSANKRENSKIVKDATTCDEGEILSDSQPHRTFYIENKSDKFGTFIIKKTSDLPEKPVQISLLQNDGGKFQDNEKTANGFIDNESLETLEEDFDEAEERRIRFSRACKRGVDVESPRQEPESKRTRRIIQRRKSIAAPFWHSELRSTTLSENEFEKSDKKDAKQEKRKQVKLFSPRKSAHTDDVSTQSPTAPQTQNFTSTITVPDFITPPANMGLQNVQTNGTKPSAKHYLKQSLIQTRSEGVQTDETIPLAERSIEKEPVQMRSEGVQTIEKEIVTTSLKDQYVQCNLSSNSADDYLLESLKPYLADMNLRQKLHFKQKIFQSLMDVFDDGNNFPEPGEVITQDYFKPFSDSTTREELVLLRELVAVVQSAKHKTPERVKDSHQNIVVAKKLDNAGSNSTTQDLIKVPKLSVIKPKETINKLDETSPKQTKLTIVNDVGIKLKETIQTPKQIPTLSSKTTLPHHILRKVVQIGGKNGGTLTTQDGDKRRVYRIYPRSSLVGNTSITNTASRSVGTFIIPRTIVTTSTAPTVTAVTTTATTNTVQLSPAPKITPATIAPVKVTSVSPLKNSNLVPTVGDNDDIQQSITEMPSSGSKSSYMLRRYSLCGPEGIPAFTRSPQQQVITTSANDEPRPAASITAFSGTKPSGISASNVRSVLNVSTASSPKQGYQFIPQTVVHVPLKNITSSTQSTECGPKIVSVPPGVLSNIILQQQQQMTHDSRQLRKSGQQHNLTAGVITCDGFLNIKKEALDESFH